MIDASTPPVWDPQPRRPRPTLALIGLAIVLVTVTAGVVLLRSGLEHRHGKGPAPCEKLDLSAFSKVLGSTPQVARSEFTDTSCGIAYPGTGLRLGGTGTLDLTYAINALGARWYDQQRSQPAGAKGVDDLGDTARLTVTPAAEVPVCLVEVVVIDSNLRLELRMGFPSDDGSTTCGRLDDLGDAAVRTARGFLTVL